MNGNLASSPIKNNFLPINDRPLFRALQQRRKKWVHLAHVHDEF
jgi:hypothetical protein